jgi:membrane protease YdiL (CAAX protease family)
MNWFWPTTWIGERGGWWRLIVTLGLYTIGVVLGMLLYTQANISGLKAATLNQPPHVREIVALIATMVVTGCGLAGCLAGVRFVHRKPIACVFTDGRPFGMALAMQSAALWALLWLAFTLPLPHAWERLIQRTQEIPRSWWPIIVVVTAAAMTVGRATEEIVFRGYLLPRIAAWVKRPWLAVCIVALVFNAIHQGNLAAHTAITLVGVAWGASCIRAGTLAPAIGAHVAHDAMNCLLQPGEGNASATWLEAILIAIALAIWWGWLLWVTRAKSNNSLGQTSEAEPEPNPGPTSPAT